MVGMIFGARRTPMQSSQKKSSQSPKQKNKVRITTYWDRDQDQDPVTFVTDIRNWLDLSGIPNSLHTRVSRDHEMPRDIHQTTIEFNHPADLAVFKLGYVFTGPVDIQCF